MIGFRKLRFGQVPDYGYRLSGFPVSRYLMEAVISGLFLILGTWPARRFVEIFRPEFIGRMFERTRKVWKRSTRNIKRKELT